MRPVIFALALLSSPALLADRHCSQGFGWLTIVQSRIENTQTPAACSAQRDELMALITDVKQDFELCGCPQSREKLDALMWPMSQTPEACLKNRTRFQEQVAQLRHFANDECGH